MKNSKQLFKRGLLSCMVAALAMGFAVAQENQEETVWTDVTQYFIVNPDYSNGTTGWTDGTAVPKVDYHNAELYQTNAPPPRSEPITQKTLRISFTEA